MFLGKVRRLGKIAFFLWLEIYRGTSYFDFIARINRRLEFFIFKRIDFRVKKGRFLSFDI